ncbi:isochorismatase family protein [Nocardia arthritidis]|uniref:Isochorismatase family protein n=1 Tax=Nocardia arthritidis TaxID=228602 RepID=A0A6G9YPR5_9NOCA|nr:isochorismatase family protein [Nocardia arthritidis]QIS15204.1 isochorismatase family protein [Nocardia arthritidis]
MSMLENRPHTALLVIDVQDAFVAGTYERDAVISRIGDLVTQARRDDVPVIWIQHSNDEVPIGSDGWAIVAELKPADTERRIEKKYGDSFEDTALESILADLGIGRLVISGAQTDGCIRSTLHGALTRGYDTILVSDAHTTEDLTQWGAPSPEKVIAHTNLYWSFQAAPGRTAGVVETKDVEFRS